jgi:predicted metal-dependent enzyme (double-stranded beta helix superfamily)
MSIAPLRDFVCSMTRLVECRGNAEQDVLEPARDLLAGLVRRDDWLPDVFAEPDAARYRQYLLYGDPMDRFSLVSFVWGPGQSTPVHDHLVWGLIGMLRGEEVAVPYTTACGRLEAGDPTCLRPGMVDAVSPTIGDVHTVANAFADRASISIHLYGGNIGKIRRHVFVAETGEAKDFTSGYSSAVLPNLWV